MSTDAAKKIIESGIESLERECEEETSQLGDNFARIIDLLIDQGCCKWSVEKIRVAVNQDLAKWGSPFELYRHASVDRFVLRRK